MFTEVCKLLLLQQLLSDFVLPACLFQRSLQISWVPEGLPKNLIVAATFFAGRMPFLSLNQQCQSTE